MRYVLKSIFKFIYKILSLFNLQLTLFISLIGVVLYFTGIWDKNPIVVLIFKIALIFSLIFALFQTIKGLLGLNKKIKKSKGVQIVDTDNSGEDDKKEEDIKTEPVTINAETPKYFRVKQNPNLVMAEFLDRYELYKIENGKLIRIRTDYK